MVSILIIYHLDIGLKNILRVYFFIRDYRLLENKDKNGKKFNFPSFFSLNRSDFILDFRNRILNFKPTILYSILTQFSLSKIIDKYILIFWGGGANLPPFSCGKVKPSIT